MRRHDDDRQRRVLGFDLAQEFQAIGARHAHIADDDAGEGVVQGVQRIVSAGKALVGDIAARERLFQHPADGFVVVDDPDRLRHVGSPCGVIDRGRTASVP